MIQRLKISFTLFFTIISLSLSADDLLSPISMATGTVKSTPHLSNPYFESEAVNSLCKDMTLSLSYTNRLFLPQIGKSTLHSIFPHRIINTSASFSYYGFNQYWNINASVGFSKFFKPYFAIGLGAFFSGFHISPNETFKATGGVNLSLLAFPTKKLTIGLYTYNISFSTIKALDEKYRLPVIIRLGLSYNFSNKVLLSLEGGIELKQPFIICMGFEYMPIKQFILRCGISYQTTAAANIGFGLRFGGFLLDFGAEYKLISGMSCSVGVGYSFSKIKKDE